MRSNQTKQKRVRERSGRRDTAQNTKHLLDSCWIRSIAASFALHKTIIIKFELPYMIGARHCL